MFDQQLQPRQDLLGRDASIDSLELSSFCPPCEFRPEYNPLRDGEVVLYDGTTVAKTVESLARALVAYSTAKKSPPVFVGVAEGGLWLTYALLNAPLLRRALQAPELVLIDAKRYSGQVADEKATLIRSLSLSAEDLQSKIKDRDLVVIDDMLDEGQSLLHVREHLRQNGAARCDCCVLLARRRLGMYDALCEAVIGAPLVLEDDFPGVSPWIFGCGPDWGRDELGPEEKTLSRYRTEISADGRLALPVVAAFAESVRGG